MGASSLSSRAVIGAFYARLEQVISLSWAGKIGMGPFLSDQASETYAWLGMAPAMREWIGGRNAKGFRENGITIINKKFEATLEVTLDEIRRDKTGQVMIRINEMADRAAAHWIKLVSDLLLTGESAVCYDGQYFFDTDHTEGDSGTQDNDLTYDATTTTAPTAAEYEAGIMKAIAAILAFKDDQGEPMNEMAQTFLVMVPPTHMAAALAAVTNPTIVDGSGSRTNTLVNANNFKIEVVTNPRFSTLTTKFMVFRTDGNVKPIILQEEEELTISAQAEGSPIEFTDDKHQYGVKAIRNVGFGYWQHAALVTFV